MSFAAHFNDIAQNTFKEELDKANTLSLTGRALESSLRETNSAPDDNYRNGDKDKKKKQDRDFKNLLERLQEHRRWLLQQMEEIQNRINELNEEIDERGRKIDAVNKFMDELHEKGILALGEDGYPKDNPKAKEAIQAFERKNHKKVVLTSADAQTTLLLIADDLNAEKTQKINERDVEQKKWDEFNGKRNATEEAINDLKEDGSVSVQKYNQLDAWLKRLENAEQPYSKATSIPDNTENNEVSKVEALPKENPFDNMPGLG